MLFAKSKARTAAVAAVALGAFALGLAGCTTSGGGGGGGGGELNLLTFNATEGDHRLDEMVSAFEKDNPDIKVNVAFMPAGAEGDNIVKTKLATGEMEDAFFYIGGSLMAALHPDDTLLDLSDQPWVSDLADSFTTTVDTDKGIYGAPMGTAQAGVVLYNKKIYAQLGLEVPTDWAGFMANSEAIKASGIAAPIIQTYADTWTSQLFVLGDFGNVSKQDPDWPTKFTANQVKTADEPAVQAWKNMQQVAEAGLFNENFASATFDDGMTMLATGEGAQYPMLSGQITTLVQNNPDAVDDIGGFALPAQNSDDTTLTVWPPNAWFIPKTTTGDHLTNAEKFLAFVNSPEGCDVQNKFGTPSGPYVISTCQLPDDVAPLLTDLQKYFDADNTAPALEFVSPIKGPNLEFITVEVGSGIRSGEDGAALYDEDVKKQAQQLGLDGW